MSRPQASGLVHSVQARLKNEARESDRPFAELLDLYAVERFLHRLGRSPHRDHFVLKGALPLRHWLIGVVASIRRFAQPILDAAREDRPFRQRWPRGGPWRKEGGASDA